LNGEGEYCYFYGILKKCNHKDGDMDMAGEKSKDSIPSRDGILGFSTSKTSHIYDSHFPKFHKIFRPNLQ
jgi:hypothetical protein